VYAAIVVQPRDVVAIGPAHNREIAANNDFAIALKGDGANRAVDIRIESIQSALCEKRRTAQKQGKTDNCGVNAHSTTITDCGQSLEHRVWQENEVCIRG